MQHPTSAISELELNGASPIEFMKRLCIVLDRLGWKLIDTEFETIEIVVPRKDDKGLGELYVELDEEKANLRFHISGGQDVTAELMETIMLFKQEFTDVLTTDENEVYLRAHI